MCGIVYAHDLDGNPVNNLVLEQYDRQRTRGVQGFGLFDGSKLNMVRHSKEDGILKWLVNYDSDLILFHHRYPTSTINVKRTAHPFSTKDYFGDTQYILVHNGYITNDAELWDKHTDMGIKYYSQLPDYTFNDSEALLWDFALTMEGKQKEMLARGAIAFICLRLDNGKLTKMYFGRNSNPLNMYRDKTGITLSSEGVGEPIDENTLYTYNYELNRLTKRKFELKRWQNSTHTTEYTGYSGNYSYTSTPRHYDYDRDGNPLYEYDEEDDYDYTWDNPELRQTQLDFDDEINELVIEYLNRCGGKFEQAYWLAEADYDVLLDEGTDNDLYIQEQVLSSIAQDPEYITEHSVSSAWMAIYA